MKKTLDEWKEEQIQKGNLWLSKTKPPELMGKWKRKYNSKKSNAKCNNVLFLLSFEEYLILCFNAKLNCPSKIGTKPKSYQLGRIRDIGPYSFDNCRFITQKKNNKERLEHFNVTLDNKRRINEGTHNFLNQPAWLKPCVTENSLEVWEKSYLLYCIWKVENIGYRALMKKFNLKSQGAIRNLVSKFEQGWNPIQDESWTSWKKVCPNDLKIFNRNKEKIHDNV